VSQPTPARIGAGGWARIAVRSLAIVLVLDRAVGLRRAVGK